MDNLLVIISLVVGAITTITGTITSIISKFKIKNLKDSATLHDRMLYDIMEAETMFDAFKVVGINVSGMKKRHVLDDLRNYALTNGKEFDEQLYSQEIERMIEFSDKVNGKVGK